MFLDSVVGLMLGDCHILSQCCREIVIIIPILKVRFNICTRSYSQ